MLTFFKTKIWTLRLADYPFVTRNLLSILRIAILSGRFFVKNQCMLRASALTYYTLLALIPVAALAFAIAKGFGLYTRLETWLRTSLSGPGQEEVAEKIITFSGNMLENAKGGVIAGIGAIALLFITIRLMMQIENSLNDIWGVKYGRSIIRKVSDYLSIVLLCPIIIIVSAGVTVYATVRLSGIVNDIPGLSGTMNHLLALSSHTLPLIAIWMVFTFIYIFIPNTKVKIIPALTGGFFAGILYYTIQSLYIAAQFNVAKYNAIYGSFAALPLFLVWLQISWTFILLGAEIAFSCQNVSTYEGTPGDGSVGSTRKLIYAIKLVRECALNFNAEKQPYTDTQLSEKLQIPVRTTRLLLYELTQLNILSKVVFEDSSEGYQVAIPPERITAVMLMKSLQNSFQDEGLDTTDPVYCEIMDIWTAANESKANRPLIENSNS